MPAKHDTDFLRAGYARLTQRTGTDRRRGRPSFGGETTSAAVERIDSTIFHRNSVVTEFHRVTALSESCYTFFNEITPLAVSFMCDRGDGTGREIFVSSKREQSRGSGLHDGSKNLPRWFGCGTHWAQLRVCTLPWRMMRYCSWGKQNPSCIIQA